MLLPITFVLSIHLPLVTRPARSTVVAAAVANEFARPVSVANVARKANRITVEATPEECAALATRFELESIGSLSANVSLSLVEKRRNRVRAAGKLSATDVRRVSFSGQVTTIQVADSAATLSLIARRPMCE